MFFKNIHIRMKIIVLIMCFCFLLIIGKVFFIQVIDYKKINKLANSLWSRNLPIEADRGKIYDRNGIVLASNITASSVIVIPNQVEDKETTAKELSKVLNTDYDTIFKSVSKKSSIERIHSSGRRINYDTASKIASLNLKGVYLVKESKRYYEYDKTLSHTIGFVGIDNQGLSGLELMYDNYLTGAYGAIKYYSDAKGNRLKMNEVYEEPQDGINMTLTVNYKIQESLERELDNAVLKYNPEHALGIVMDPNNGEILAISSRPNYSPSNYQDYTIEEINRNLPIWMTYEPGSTFKIITLATALEEKLVDLNKDTYYDSGSINVEGARIKCWKAGGHGLQTYMQVVQNSCNPGFVTLGQKIGKEKLFKYIDKFGFGTKTGIDLNGEATGIIFDIDDVGPVELATTSFGQGVSVTPIQQVTAVSAAINGGILYKPYIVKTLNEPATNNVIKENKSTIIRKVISEDTSNKVKEALENVVSLGSGRNAYIEGYRVAGKTGTAQKVNNGVYMVGNYITSFIGFMPADNPKVVIYIAIDNAKGVTQYGGTVAAPIARNVLLDIIDVLNLKKQTKGVAKNYNYYDIKNYNVPNVVGMNIKEALKILKEFKVEIEGTGEKIIYQSPNPFTALYEGSSIRIMLGN
ncbi:MAG TPA: stage V sporulation protein D [Bacilli bacterium]|nr:stage V sporulation protein D [Bacilli bacterium]